MRIQKIVVGRMETNCYVIYEDRRKEAVVVDPGSDAEKIRKKLTELDVSPCAVLLTHGHFDHILAADVLRDWYGVPVICSEEEKETLADPSWNLTAFFNKGMRIIPDRTVKDGEELELGGLSIRMIHTPGHTPGGCCYYLEQDHVLISGDTLFYESIGRTDFPNGDPDALLRSVEEKLMLLPEETVVYPGHGESTTLGYEKKHNPYLRWNWMDGE